MATSARISRRAFGAEALVLPFPNKVAVVYMSGAQLLEALEAASQALPYTAETADACASLMQVSGLTYTVDTAKAYDALEAYGDHWFTAGSVSRVSISDVNGQPFDETATYAVVTSNANFSGMDSLLCLQNRCGGKRAERRHRRRRARRGLVVYRFRLNNQIGDAHTPRRRSRLTVR
ncbi:MAG: 5'-nucleotidase C-terminal domain-containing protein [Oscillospiraceae bacterium]